MTTMRSMHAGSVSTEHLNTQLSLSGWVFRRRDHGGVIFIDLRDHTGLVQLVIDPTANNEALKHGHALRGEYVIHVRGTVQRRSEETINPNLPTGALEVHVTELNFLNRAEPLPFQLEGQEASEDLRLTYRYLDMRRPEVQNLIRLRHKITSTIRTFLNNEDFVDIETPTLSKSTPEGARDFLVPSRTNPGQFFALPQSPQVYKQLLMASGFDKYYQVARCYRDEDLRANRQPEFTQLDIEMAFVEEKDVMGLMEQMLKKLWKDFKQVELTTPLRRLPFDQAFASYGSDKPDLRFDLTIHNVTSLFESIELKFLRTVIERGGMIGTLCLKEKQLSRSELEHWVSRTIQDFGGSGLLYIKFDDDGKHASPVSKFLPEDFFQQAQKLIPELSGGDTLFIVAGPYRDAWTTLGRLRIELGKALDLIDTTRDELLWVTDFPLLEWDDDANRWNACHHPFTSPQANFDTKDPASIKARAYDLVCNGEELGGGSIRIHQRQDQEAMFKLLGMNLDQARQDFGFLLKAQNLGFPPHGGIALGLDRLIMLFGKTESIRDVIPFPKTQSMRCLMMDTPSPVSDEQLSELELKSTYVPEE